MAFKVEMHHRDRCDNYKQALDLFGRTKPWRNGGEDHPLPNKRVRHMGVRKLPDGSIAFRFHHTDVVTWHPDETYTLVPYQSQSTCDFANAFLPYGHNLCKTGAVLGIYERTGPSVYYVYYPVEYDSKVHVNPALKAPTHQLKSIFVRPRVNRKAAKVARDKTRYAEFAEWYKLMMAMRNNMPIMHGEFTYNVTSHDILNALADESRWHDLMTSRYCHMTSFYFRSDILGHIRDAIYRDSRYTNPVYYYETADTLDTYPLKPWEITARS